jgi:hypothetical protein
MLLLECGESKQQLVLKLRKQKKPEELSKQNDQNLGKAPTMIDDQRNLR